MEPKLFERMPNVTWTGALLTLIALAVAGCGGSGLELADVSGKVLLNGQPLSKGSVVTVPPAGRGSFGILQPDGTFELASGRLPGAQVGTHKVSIVAFENGGGQGAESQQGKSLVPERYNNPESSGLTLEVKSDEENSPVFELKSP